MGRNTNADYVLFGLARSVVDCIIVDVELSESEPPFVSPGSAPCDRPRHSREARSPERDFLISSRRELVDTIRGPIEPAIDVSVKDVPGLWVSNLGSDLRGLSWTVGLEEQSDL